MVLFPQLSLDHSHRRMKRFLLVPRLNTRHPPDSPDPPDPPDLVLSPPDLVLSPLPSLSTPSSRSFDWDFPTLTLSIHLRMNPLISHPSKRLPYSVEEPAKDRLRPRDLAGILFPSDKQLDRVLVNWLMGFLVLSCWAWPSFLNLILCINHLETGPACVLLCSFSAAKSKIIPYKSSLNCSSSASSSERPCASVDDCSLYRADRCSLAIKSNIVSFVRHIKFSGFFKNLANLLVWHMSDALNLSAISLFILTNWLALRDVLGIISRVGLSWLVWIGYQRGHFRIEKSCDSLSFVETKIIRPIIYSSGIDWLPVLQPKNLSSLWERVLLSSIQKIVSQVSVTFVPILRAIIDHVLVVGLKKVAAMNVSLQIPTCQCPVDWVLCVVFSVVRCVLVNASGKVFIASNLLSDIDFGSLAIMEKFTTKLWNFFSILCLMFLIFCLCSVFVVYVISHPSGFRCEQILLYRV